MTVIMLAAIALALAAQLAAVARLAPGRTDGGPEGAEDDTAQRGGS